MKKPGFDKEKLAEVKEIIEIAAALMAEKDCGNGTKGGQELAALQGRLQQVTGNSELDITGFRRYWSYTSLETVAKKALIYPPSKDGFTDAEIKEIVIGILDHDEAETDYWLDSLKLCTGLANLTDYIFYPNLVGLGAHASLEEVADKILADRKK